MARSKGYLDHLKSEAMRQKGYTVPPNQPDQVKYQVASKQGVPLNRGYNGNLTAKQAGKVGGPIGGAMVKEMIRMAEQQLQQQQSPRS